MKRFLQTCAASMTFLLATTGAAAVAERNAQAPVVHPRLPSIHTKASIPFHDQGVPQMAGPAGLPDPSTLRAQGHILYTTHCASCHGANLAGSAGIPSLRHAGGAAVDFYLTTGRMPGVKPNVQAVHAEPHFTANEIAALDRFVDSVAQSSVAIPLVVTDTRLLADGRRLFEENCEACHGAAGEGATAGGMWTALPLDKANPTQIGEAIRFGPGVMPRFTPALLSEQDTDALATYIEYLHTDKQTYGGLTMDYLGPIAEGAVGAVVGVGLLFWVVFFTGTKADGSRLNKRS